MTNLPPRIVFRRIARILLWAIGVVGIYGILLFVPWQFWVEHATSIEVCTLGEVTEDSSGFPVKPYGTRYEILRRVDLEGEKAASVSSSLLSAVQQGGRGYACHDPVYGLRFFIGPFCTFETSVCFKCSNFSIREILSYHWQGLSERQAELREILEGILPIPSSRLTGQE